MYKKILAITLAALLFLAGVNPAFTQDGNDNPPDGTIALTIVHTNDTHGQYKNSASTVGFEKVKAIADKENADLILDAGDAFHGLPFATIERGKALRSCSVQLDMMRYVLGIMILITAQQR